MSVSRFMLSRFLICSPALVTRCRSLLARGRLPHQGDDYASQSPTTSKFRMPGRSVNARSPEPQLLLSLLRHDFLKDALEPPELFGRLLLNRRVVPRHDEFGSGIKVLVESLDTVETAPYGQQRPGSMDFHDRMNGVPVQGLAILCQLRACDGHVPVPLAGVELRQA